MPMQCNNLSSLFNTTFLFVKILIYSHRCPTSSRPVAPLGAVLHNELASCDIYKDIYTAIMCIIYLFKVSIESD